jgi:hypothetical protein
LALHASLNIALRLLDTLLTLPAIVCPSESTFPSSPLEYARDPHELYLRPAGSARPEEIVLLGMKPRSLGLEIDAETGASGWYGEPMDYDLAVFGLLDADVTDCAFNVAG